MADSASTELKIRLMEDGVTSSWGDKVDTNMQIIEHALTGSATASLAGGDWTLADVDYTEDEGKASILIATGSLGANRNIVIPNKKKFWVVKNDTSGAYTVTVKTSGGTGKTVTQSTVATFWCDGADAVYHVVPMVNATTGAPATSSGAAASSVSFTATGSISSTNVQAAIAEVDGDVTALSAAVAAGYQPLDSDLTAIAGLSAADGNFVVGDGVTWTVESGATARTSMGAQTQDDFLDDIADLTDPGADRGMFWDDSAGKIDWLAFGGGLTMSGTTLTTTAMTMQVFEYTGSNQTWTKPTGLMAVLVIAIGAGGGGGGSGTQDNRVGSGGGGGGMSIKRIAAGSLGATETVVIGQGGTGGTTTGDGAAGGTTFFGYVSASEYELKATGGSGGHVGNTGLLGGAGGTGDGGNLNVTGETGGNSVGGTAASSIPDGHGGAAPFIGIRASAAYQSNGESAPSYGGGGAGGCRVHSSSFTGGTGGHGVCIVLEFY